MTEHHDLVEAGRELLTREAAYLDDRRWDDWLGLFDPNCEYWVPTWISEDELATDHQSQLSQVYYASRAGLEDRIARIRTGKSPASVPLRRTTHLVGSVLLLEGAADSMKLRSSWTSHIYDPNSKKTFVLFGSAHYELAKKAGGWVIAKKKTIVQNDYLPSMVDVYCI